MGAGYRLFLVPVDDDGTISGSFLEEAKSAAPLVSKDRPIDVPAARLLLLSNLELAEGFLERLRDLAEVLPVSKDQAAMFDDQVPCDEASFLFGALENAAKETLPAMFEELRRAATVTDDELRKDFFARHARYLADQERRLGKAQS